MQTVELIPYLAISTAISCLAMMVIGRAWWKTRRLPCLLYTFTIILFSAMALDLLLDQIYMPFREWHIYIREQRLWMSNVLLAFFIVGGFLFWYYAVMYSQYDNLPFRSNILAFIAGAALFSELLRMDWSRVFPLIVEALAFSILTIEVIRYGRRVLRTTKNPQLRRQIALYFLGFQVWIIAGIIGIVIKGTPGVPAHVGDLWPIPYTTGLLMVAIAVAINPRLLFISEARPLDLLILEKEGTLVYSHRFHEYEGSIDSELMGSAMSGVMSLMREMLASDAHLDRVDHGDVRILVENGILITALLVATQETPSLRQSLRNAVLEFESNYRLALLEQSALVSSYASFTQRAEELFS